MDKNSISKLLETIKIKFSADQIHEVSFTDTKLTIRVISEKFFGMSKPQRFKKLAEVCKPEIAQDPILLSFEAWTAEEYSRIKKSSDGGSNSNTGSSGHGGKQSYGSAKEKEAASGPDLLGP